MENEAEGSRRIDRPSCLRRASNSFSHGPASSLVSEILFERTKAEMSTPKIPLFERLQIESQSNSNRSCWFCPRTYDRSGKYLDVAGKPIFNEMPTEKILDLLDQAHAMGFRGRVAFYHYSEPLLDKRNIMLAQEAKR